MRQIEPLMDDYQTVFDAWQEAGVEGMVIGPLRFAGGHLAYDPDPHVYKQFGCEVPSAPADDYPQKRQRLERMLSEAVRRGIEVWIFEPGYYLTTPEGSHWSDPRWSIPYAARTVDTMNHFPMATGAVTDGPEWGYEICPHLMGYHSFIFKDLPVNVAPRCESLGFDYQSLVAAKDSLYRCLHELPLQRRDWTHDGNPFGCKELFGDIEGLQQWLSFRCHVLEDVALQRTKALRDSGGRHFKLAMGLRTPAFAGLTGVDLERWARIPDVILPKHYFWHRGFDGLYGTVFRYVEVLTAWNPGMTDAAAMGIVKAIFGLDMPWITNRDDFDKGFPDEFFDGIVQSETRRSLAAVDDDPARVLPWVDAGRRPHGGDPFPASELRRTLETSAAAGLEQFLFHHHYTLTAANWQVISSICGESWRPQYHDQRALPVLDPESLSMHSGPSNYEGFEPPDRDIM